MLSIKTKEAATNQVCNVYHQAIELLGICVSDWDEAVESCDVQ